MTKISNQYSLTNILTADLANSRLGINNVSPTVALDVTGAGRFSGVVTLNSNEPLILNRANNTSTSNAIRFQTGGTTQWYVGSDYYLQSGTENFGFYNGSYKLTITPAGNVGIGTSSPNFKLHISTGTTTSITEPTAGSYGLYIQQNTSGSTGGLYIQDGASNSGNSIYVGDNNGAARFIVNTDGNVGIGTTSPSDLLSLSGSQIGLSINSQTTGDAYIRFRIDGTVKTDMYVDRATDNFLIGPSVSSALIFKTNATERMRITSGGFTKMSNDGTYNSSTGVYHEISSSTTNNNVLLVRNTSASPYGPYFHFPNASPNNGTNYFLDCSDSTTIRFQLRSNGGLANYAANDVNLSDIRTKKDIIPLGSYWDKFKAIEIVKFKYKDQSHDDYNIGVISQQVESVAPEFVDIDGFGITPEDGIPLKSIYTADLYHATIKVLQEAMIKIEELSAKVSLLENK